MGPRTSNKSWPDQFIAERNPRDLSYDRLLEYAEHARRQYIELCRAKDEQEERLIHLQKEHSRVLSFSSSLSGAEFPSAWIRAHIDSPDETSGSCFGDKAKYPVVIGYFPLQSVLKACTKEEIFKESTRGIYTRLPSHGASTLYVSHTSSCKESGREYWVSTKKNTRDDFVLHWTIHLNRLDLLTQARIWFGRTRWLFIAFEDGSDEKLNPEYTKSAASHVSPKKPQSHSPPMSK